MNVLAVIDMQHDFIDGALGTPEALAILPAVARRIAQARSRGDHIVFTRDTHGDTYLETQEGGKLPVPHCIKGSPGWTLHEALDVREGEVLDKVSFGSIELAERIAALKPDAVELVGLCTDICVISNALILKARLPETPIRVCSSCCAGVSVESHENAIAAMKTCQVDIVD